MKTKTLLLTAALTAAGIASSMAQVYSVNAVGYVNVTVKSGFNMIANPLNNGGNTPIEIIPPTTNLPETSYITTFNSALGSTGSYDSETPTFYPGPEGGWDPAGSPLPPGKAFFLYVAGPPGQQYVITFVGEVPQSVGGAPLSNPVAGGGKNNLLSSQVPQTGQVTTDLGLQPADSDLIYTWDQGRTPPGFTGRTFQYYAEASSWSPDGSTVEEPVIPVGGGFFLLRTQTAPTAWTRTFSVNPTP